MLTRFWKITKIQDENRTLKQKHTKLRNEQNRLKPFKAKNDKLEKKNDNLNVQELSNKKIKDLRVQKNITRAWNALHAYTQSICYDVHACNAITWNTYKIHKVHVHVSRVIFSSLKARFSFSFFFSLRFPRNTKCITRTCISCHAMCGFVRWASTFFC